MRRFLTCLLRGHRYAITLYPGIVIGADLVECSRCGKWAVQ